MVSGMAAGLLVAFVLRRAMCDGGTIAAMTEADRRHFLAVFAATGLSSTLLPGILWAQIQPGTQPQARVSTPQELSEQRQVLVDRQREEQAARNRLVTLQKSLEAEQAKRTELAARLDELERSLESR